MHSQLDFGLYYEPRQSRFLPAVLAAKADPLHLVVRGVKGEGGMRSRGKPGGRWHQVRVHIQIDLVTGSHHIGPVNRGIADAKLDLFGHLISDLEIEFRNDRELILSVGSNIGGLCQQATGVGRGDGWATRGVGDCRLPCNADLLLRVAPRQSDACVQAPETASATGKSIFNCFILGNTPEVLKVTLYFDKP